MTKLQEPRSMSECVYFTNRLVGNGKLKAWVFRELCPECKKALMGKPINPKTNRPKPRAKEYICSECNYTEEEKIYEEKLEINIQYLCPKCSNSDEIKLPYKRKKVQRFDEEKQKKVTVEAVRFQCSKCNENIDVSKKMK